MSANDSTQSSGYMKREQLIGKSVVASNAEIVGIVKEISVAIDGKVGLHVERKSVSSGETSEVMIKADEIQAMGDVVLLKPAGSPRVADTAPKPMPPPFPSAAPTTRTCSRCGHVNGANSRFCIKCGMSLQ